MSPNFQQLTRSRILSAPKRCGSTQLEYVVIIFFVISCVLGISQTLSPNIGFDIVSKSLGGDLPDNLHDCQTDMCRESSGNLSKVRHSPNGYNTSLATIFMLTSMLAGLLYFRLSINKCKKNEDAETEQELYGPITDAKISDALEKVFRKRTSMKQQFEESWGRLIVGLGTVEDYMSKDVVTIDPRTPVEDAKQFLEQKGFRRVLVVDQQGKLAGVVSKKDLTTKQGRFVKNVMTSEPITAAPDLRIGIALSILLKERISCIPVVKDGYHVGLLSTSDFMILLQCILFFLEEQRQINNNIR